VSKFKQDTQDTRPLGSPQSWARTPGTYIAAQALIDGVDQVAIAMEERWGAGRLRLLVSAELRERFDRQRYLFNRSIWHGDLESIRRESSRMVTAWQALSRAAEVNGAAPLSPSIWEVTLEDGTVAAIVKTREEAKAVMPEGRKVVVYTLDELGRLLSNYRAVTEVKTTFPGATVVAIRRTVGDPLDALTDSNLALDDEIPDFGNPLAN
jgi:hypothetical protein